MPKNTTEDVDVADDQLVRAEPYDRDFKRHTLVWVGVISVATLVCACVLAVWTRSVPPALFVALLGLVTTLAVIVRDVFRGPPRAR